MKLQKQPSGWNRRAHLVIWQALWLASFSVGAAELTDPPVDAAHLFQATKVWNLYLQFTSEQWQAMEPAGGGAARPFGGPPFGGRGGGPGGFGPATFL